MSEQDSQTLLSTMDVLLFNFAQKNNMQVSTETRYEKKQHAAFTNNAQSFAIDIEICGGRENRLRLFQETRESMTDFGTFNPHDPQDHDKIMRVLRDVTSPQTTKP